MPVIYYAGLALVGFFVLVTSIGVPVVILTGNRIKKQLESDYGKTSRHKQ